jgi:hypothetical protein
MKNELLKLYKKNLHAFSRIRETFPNDDLPGPFLMNPNSLYYKQQNKLLIIGQQTKGWTYHHDNIEKQINTYDKFNIGEDYYASPFWNITRKLEKALGNEPLSCAWTNINKFDLDEDKPTGEYETEISKLDAILVEEINIIQPNICMFFTGPSFDYRLKYLFPRIEFIKLENWNSRQFCKLKHPELPEKSFRSYHPKYLRINYLEDGFLEEMEKYK